MSVLRAQRRPIVVGIDYRNIDEKFIASCATLAQKLNSPLELVHAVESSFDFMVPADVIVNPFYAYEKALAEMEESEAREKLESIKKQLPASLISHVHIIRGLPAEALLTVGQETKAGLIVCGAQSKSARNIFRGVSTAFSLATHADIPLLLLPMGESINFQDPLKMLIADNLEIEGRFSLENALRLAEDLGSSAIYHVHIHPRSAAQITAFASQLSPSMEEANPLFNGPRYLEMIQQRIIDDLLYRFHNSEGAQQLVARYEARIVFGEDSGELQRACKETGARILVFGRHHLIHRKSFSLGKLPCGALLDEQAAIVIVPDASRYPPGGRSYPFDPSTRIQRRG